MPSLLVTYKVDLWPTGKLAHQETLFVRPFLLKRALAAPSKESSSSVQLCHRGGCGTSIHSVYIELAQVAIQELTADTFREYVGWILVTLYLENGEIAASQAFLDP